MPSNELRHYGVPGMKWGQRRAGGSSEKAPSARRVESDRVKADRVIARREMPARDKAYKLAMAQYKAAPRGSAQKAAASKRLDKADNEWADSYYRANAKTKGETQLGVGLAVGGLAASVAVRAGAQWALKNPQKVANLVGTAKRLIDNQPAIDTGYKVVQMGLKNGVWR